MLKLKVMENGDLKRGVYTAICDRCTRPNYMHIDGNGGYDPVKCGTCKNAIHGVKRGQKKNQYIAYCEPEASSPATEELKAPEVKAARKIEVKAEEGPREEKKKFTKKQDDSFVFRAY